MRVRVDHHRHRVVGERLDLGEQRRAPPRILRIDQRHPLRGHEHGSVTAAAAQHEQVVLHLFDGDGGGRRLRYGRLRRGLHRDRHAADRDQYSKNGYAFHGWILPRGDRSAADTKNARNRAMRSRPGSEMTSSTSPVVWYSGGACMTLTFATFKPAHPPVSPLWNVERSEMKLTPKRAGPLSMSSCRNGELLVT